MAFNFWNETSGKSGFFRGIFNGWRTIDYAELHNPPPDSQLLTRFQSCYPARSIGPDVARMHFVSPYLSFPSDVTDIDPAWKAWDDHTCSPNLIGVVDPPTVLHRATALTTTPMMTIAKTETQSSQAIPAATASAPYSATAATTSQSNRDSSSIRESDPRSGGSSRQSQSDSADPASGSLSSTVQHAVKSIAKDPGESTIVVQNLGSHAAGAFLPAPSSQSGSRPSTKSSDREEKHDSVNIAVTLMPETVKPSATSLKSKAKPATDTRPEASDPPIVSNSNSSPHTTGSTTPKSIQITIASLTVSNNVESIAMDSSTFDVKPTSATAPLLTQNQVLQLRSGKFEIAGQTITPGSEVKISDQQLKYGASGEVVVDGTSHTLMLISTGNPLVIGSQTIRRASDGGLLITGSTLANGRKATLFGHTYSLDGSSILIADEKSYSLPQVGNAYLVQNVDRFNPLPTKIGKQSMTYSNGLAAQADYSLPTPTTALVGNLINHVTPNLDASSSSPANAGQTPPTVPTGVPAVSTSPASTSTAFTQSGTLDALGPSAAFVSALLTITSPTPSVFTLVCQTFTAVPTGFVLNGSSVAPGAIGVQFSGVEVSLRSDGILYFGNGTCIMLPTGRRRREDIGGQRWVDLVSQQRIPPEQQGVRRS